MTYIWSLSWLIISHKRFSTHPDSDTKSWSGDWLTSLGLALLYHSCSVQFLPFLWGCARVCVCWHIYEWSMAGRERKKRTGRIKEPNCVVEHASWDHCRVIQLSNSELNGSRRRHPASGSQPINVQWLFGTTQGNTCCCLSQIMTGNMFIQTHSHKHTQGSLLCLCFSIKLTKPLSAAFSKPFSIELFSIWYLFFYLSHALWDYEQIVVLLLWKLSVASVVPSSEGFIQQTELQADSLDTYGGRR